MKAGSDNFRSAAILDIISLLQKRNVEILIYEPVINDDTFDGFKVVKNLEEFKLLSDIIVANRLENPILDVKNKVFTRDIFNSDQ
jgi:UDPglucose 6-dehydrogenase